ncbi:MAG TPA: LemA family protein [Methanomassiliicoccales archaeon]|jgi:LemA protein
MADGSGINKKIIYKIIAVGLVVIILLWTVLAYNGLVGKDQNVNAKLSEIKNSYTKKISVLPAMLNQTSVYMNYESSLLTNITALRSQWMNESKGGASAAELSNTSEQLDSQLNKIVLTWENYPDLKADALVSKYMGEIVNQEEQLSYSRTNYNTAVRDYNTAIGSFPNNLLAGTFGFGDKSYWGTGINDGTAINL